MTPNNSEVDRAENLTATSAQAVRSGRIAARHEYWHPTGRGEQERREQGGDIELGVEAVREHPHEPRARLLLERREAVGVNREVDLEWRPLMPLPVLVERPEGSGVSHELLDLHCLLVNPHATGT